MYSLEELKKLKRHVLMARIGPVTGDILPDTRFSALVLGTSGECIPLGSAKERTSTEGFLVLLRREELGVVEQNCAEIVELFDLMHPQKRVLENIDDLDQPGIVVREEKEDKVRAYADVVQSPLFSIRDGVRVITFWTIDFWTGDLEQWDVLEGDEGETRIETKVLELGLVVVLRH
jgi:hypothetical protein